jgi:hypothetical protein
VATHSQRGQVLIETVLYALLIVGIFLIAFTLSGNLIKAEEKSRFQNIRAGGLPPRGFK